MELCVFVEDTISRKETVSLFLLTVFHSLKKKYIKGNCKVIPIQAWQDLNVPESRGFRISSQLAHENV
jgi:hypothetical protein